MGKRSVTCISWMIISAIILLCPAHANAQKKLGESVVTVGAGMSMIGVASSVAVNGGQGTHEFKASPTFSGHYDVGLTTFFSLGFAATHQTFKLYYHYNIYNSAGESVTENYVDKLARTNYGLRALFHFAKNEKMDLYAGARIGYTIWNVSTNNPDTTFIVENNQPWALRTSVKYNTAYSIQGLFGMRVFFNEFIGINYEVSIGAPTFLTLGLNVKF